MIAPEAWPCWPIGLGTVGGLAGAAAGAFGLWLQTSVKTSDCADTGCEGQGLTAFFLIGPVALLGAGVGAFVGTVAGFAIGAPAGE